MTSTNSTAKNFLCKEEIDDLKIIKRRKLTNKEEVKIYHEQQNKEESKDGLSEESQKTAKEELSQNTTKNSSSSQRPQKKYWVGWGDKAEPLIKTLFVKSLESQAQKLYKERLEDDPIYQTRWPYLLKQFPQTVDCGEEVFAAADKVDDLSKRYLYYLGGAMFLLRASHTLDKASINASGLYARIGDHLRSLKEYFRMASNITKKEKIIYILGLRCLSAIYERLYILLPSETAEDQKMEMKLILLSHLEWNLANEESNNKCDEFFAQVSTDVGYKLEQRSCIRKFITFVVSCIKKLRQMN